MANLEGRNVLLWTVQYIKLEILC